MRRFLVVVLVGGLVVASAAVAGSGVASAGDPGLRIHVSTEAEYRDALAAVAAEPAGGHIVLDTDLLLQQPGDPTYTGSGFLGIDGAGHTIDGGGAHRHLLVTGTGLVSLRDLTLTNGAATAGGDGGSIASPFYVSLERVALVGNVAEGDGGAVQASGISVIESTIEANEAGGDGGALAVATPVSPVPPVAPAAFRAGVGDVPGAEGRPDPVILISRSTLSGNTAAGSGGAISSDGPTWTLNTTLSGNAAGGSGGAISTPGTSVWLIYSTLSGNEATEGAHVATRQVQSTLAVLAGAVGGPGCAREAPSDAAHSYDTDGSCGFTGEGNTSAGVDPGLGPLADNGGATLTMLPGAGSPLIDAVVPIPYRGCLRDITLDQRDQPRNQGEGCDIGSVEVAPVAPPPPAAPPVAAEPAFTG